MVFSSLSFLFVFLPLVLVVYYLTPKAYKNITLLIGSLLFYSFGEPFYIWILIFSGWIDYFHGNIIHKYRDTFKAKAALISSIVLNLMLLGFFKYGHFFIVELNRLFHFQIEPLNIRLPIGISFFTFQTMSYTIDVYRGSKPQEKFHELLMYIALFPQLIAGPIVRYNDIKGELNHRHTTDDDLSNGISRIIFGLSKKVLIANNLGQLAEIVYSTSHPTVLLYWLTTIAFTLQIYFDFSGYSDMAIGLGKLFGFHFPENFNKPFIATSIGDFWRRWHISLGSWFRDYIYIPLGGNKVNLFKQIRNIIIVWALTGFWHGASWNYILWGLYFGLFLMMEKLFLRKWLKYLPTVFSHIYVIVIVVVSFVLFRNESLSIMINHLKGMFGYETPLSSFESVYYLKSYLMTLIMGVIMCLPLKSELVMKLSTKKYMVIAFEIILGLVITSYIVDASFNPFLYFRF